MYKFVITRLETKGKMYIYTLHSKIISHVPVHLLQHSETKIIFICAQLFQGKITNEYVI